MPSRSPPPLPTPYFGPESEIKKPASVEKSLSTDNPTAHVHRRRQRDATVYHRPKGGRKSRRVARNSRRVARKSLRVARNSLRVARNSLRKSSRRGH